MKLSERIEGCPSFILKLGFPFLFTVSLSNLEVPKRSHCGRMIYISVQIDLFSLGLLQLLRKLRFGSGLGASALTPMFIFCIESLPGMCVFVKERERKSKRKFGLDSKSCRSDRSVVAYCISTAEWRL